MSDKQTIQARDWTFGITEDELVHAIFCGTTPAPYFSGTMAHSRLIARAMIEGVRQLANANASAGPSTIVVTVEGGLVQNIASRVPPLVGRKATVVDYDADGNPNAVDVFQDDGTTERAVIYKMEITGITVIPPGEG